MKLLKHCSDEQLLAYLDGQLPLLRRFAVRQHLMDCWQCRARRDELSQQTNALMQRFQDPWLANSLDVAGAKERFARARVSYERNRTATRNTSYRRRVAWAAAAVVLLISAAVFWTGRNRAPEVAAVPTETLRETQGAEARRIAARPTVSQRFSVQISEPDTTGKVSRTFLDLSYDSATRRVATRWSDPNGKMRSAVYRNGEGSYLSDGRQLRPAASVATQAHVYLASILPRDPDVSAMEDAFRSWVQAGCWRPVSLSDDFAEFARSNGSSLTAERVSPSVVRLRAVARRGGLDVEVVMDVDATGRLPLSYRTRLTRGGQCVELVLLPLEAPPFQQSVFDPRADRATVPPPQPSAAGSQPEVPVVAPAADVDVRFVEARVLAVVHAHRLCLGNQVQVLRKPNAGLLIRGTPGGGAVEQALVGDLKRLPLPPLVELDLRSSARVQRSPSAKSSRTVAPDPDPSAVETPETPVGLDALANALRATGKVPEGRINDEVNTLAAAAVTRSESALLQTWAIRDLADRLDSHSSAAAASLLRSMIDDHLHDLTESADPGTSALRDTLRLVAGGSAVLPGPHPGRVDAASLVKLAEAAHNRVLAFFASGALGLNPRSVSPAVAAREILSDWQQLPELAKRFRSTLP